MVSPLITAGIWTPGFWEIFIFFLVVLIIFGPKSIPQLGRSLGRGMREFKDASSKLTEAMDDIENDEPASKSSSKKSSAQIEGENTAPRESVATGPQGARIKENG